MATGQMDDSLERTPPIFVVQERDINLLLLEEIHADPSFVIWFGRQVGLPDAILDGAWHSVDSADGETDVLLRVQVGKERVGILIENKIAASEQPAQDRRYHRRGQRGVADGWFDRYVTCICAPQAYLEALPKDSLYEHRISYEAVAGWFAQQTVARAAWRRRTMEAAALQARKGYIKVVNDAATAFHLAYWDRLCRTQPHLRMVRPTPKGSRATWIMLSVDGWSSKMHINHKLTRGSVELSFERHTREELQRAGIDWPEDIVPVTTGGYGSLAIKVPVIAIAAPFDSQIAAVDEAFDAMQRLVPFAALLEQLPARE